MANQHMFCTCAKNECRWCFAPYDICMVCGWIDGVSLPSRDCVQSNNDPWSNAWMSYADQAAEELAYEADAAYDAMKERFSDPTDLFYDDCELPDPYPICTFTDVINDVEHVVTSYFDRLIQQCEWDNDPLPF